MASVQIGFSLITTLRVSPARSVKKKPLNFKQRIINAIIYNYYRREKSTKRIAREIGLFILAV